jgi:hypothetical protein
VVTAKVRGRLMANKQAAQKFDAVGFNLKKFRVMEINLSTGYFQGCWFNLLRVFKCLLFLDKATEVVQT